MSPISSTMPFRHPSVACTVCGKTLQVIGGKRVYRSCTSSIHFGNSKTKLEELPSASWIVRLKYKFQDTFIVFHGSIWFAESINRAVAEAQAGYAPWFCQRCGKIGLCSICGNPLDSPPGAEILDDIGRRLHVPVFAGMVPCSQCRNKGSPLSN